MRSNAADAIYAGIRIYEAVAGKPAERALFLGQSNEHPVAGNRVVGTLIDLPEFARAFHCVQGDRMVKAAGAVCNIW